MINSIICWFRGHKWNTVEMHLRYNHFGDPSITFHLQCEHCKRKRIV